MLSGIPERTVEQYRADAAYLRARHNHNAANALEERAAELARGQA
jgi:hypothetical protein